MTKTTRKYRELTSEEIACAVRLKAIFTARKAEGVVRNQTELGDRIGMTQSAVGQYLNGEIPLNLEAKLKFATALGVNITEIDPSAGDLALSEEEKILLNAFRSYGPAGREALLRVAEMAPAYQIKPDNNQ